MYTTDIDSGTVSIINATNNMLIRQIDTGERAVHVFKKSLEWNNGMLFVFEDERRGRSG